VKKFLKIKLHKLKAIELGEEDGTLWWITIKTHTAVHNGSTVNKFTRMEEFKAKDFVTNVKQVMEVLQMDIEIKQLNN
jgi:hypothetical protein